MKPTDPPPTVLTNVNGIAWADLEAVYPRPKIVLDHVRRLTLKELAAAVESNGYTPVGEPTVIVQVIVHQQVETPPRPALRAVE